MNQGADSGDVLQEPIEEIRQPAVTRVSWLRLIYALEFLISIEVIFTVWSEVGGQGHLDMMPWYLKLICVAALAWCIVRFTAGLVENPRAWNRRTVAWFAGAVVVSLIMGGITYYYHLHESEDDSDETQMTVIRGEARPDSWPI